MSWEGLVATALLGTGRRELEVDAPPGAPDDLGTVLRARDSEDALLAAAAAWAVARRAGVRPAPAAPPEAAPRDPRPLCSAAAGRRLAAMLDGEYPELLPEWLALVAAAGLRPPPERLPQLLGVAVHVPDLRAVLADAAGPRGPWLVARNPRWGSPALDWAGGSARARREILAELRPADPAAARKLLESTWDEESPEDREAFVRALATALGPDDEPFLESVLDDRRKPVRRAAAELLWSLPTSRLAARMAERATALVKVERRLEVELPAECDAAMERDGIEKRPPRGAGERQFWLAQMIEATPLAAWPGRPDELVRKKGEFADLARAAWARAALRQRNADWARALRAAADHPELLPVLPREERERAAARGTLRDAFACPRPWGVELSRAALRMVDDDLTRRERDEIAFRLHPDVLDEAIGLCDLAGFRAGMLRELR